MPTVDPKHLVYTWEDIPLLLRQDRAFSGHRTNHGYRNRNPTLFREEPDEETRAAIERAKRKYSP